MLPHSRRRCQSELQLVSKKQTGHVLLSGTDAWKFHKERQVIEGQSGTQCVEPVLRRCLLSSGRGDEMLCVFMFSTVDRTE